MLIWMQVPYGKDADAPPYSGKLGSLTCATLAKAHRHGVECWRVMVWLHWKEVSTLERPTLDEAKKAAEAEIARQLDAMGLMLK